MKKSIIYLIIILFGTSVFGQENSTVTIDVNSPRSVEPAYRISESPKIIDSIATTPVLEYPLLTIQHPTKISLDTIKPASIKTVDKLAQLYHSYVKMGIGSSIMPLGEIYYNGTRSRKYMYGLHVKHLSAFGTIKNYAPSQFDRTNANLTGAINEKNYTLKGDIHYANKGFNYYGILNDSIKRDSIAQRFSDIGGDFSFSSHKKDSAKLNYTLGLTYNNFQTKKPIIDSLSKWRTTENYFAFNGNAFYKSGKEVFAADFSVKYNGYKYGIADSSISLLDTGIVNNNTVISLKPTITTFSKNNRFRAKIGVDLTVDVANKSTFYIYPIAELKYSLLNDMFIPYGGLKGNLQQNTFKNVSQVNEFVLTNVALKNQNNAIEAYLGFKGTISKRISFNSNASFSNVKNKMLFITDTLYSLRNKFKVIYDNVSITTIEGSLSYQLVEKLKVDVIGRYFSYLCSENAYAWNLPQFQAIAKAHYNLYDKFIVNLDLNFEGGRKALIYNMEKEVKVENNQIAKNLGLISDINLSLEYRYNKRISAFLQGNNLVAQRYKRWYNTPVLGIQIMGGITFRF